MNDNDIFNFDKKIDELCLMRASESRTLSSLKEEADSRRHVVVGVGIVCSIIGVVFFQLSAGTALPMIITLAVAMFVLNSILKAVMQKSVQEAFGKFKEIKSQNENSGSKKATINEGLDLLDSDEL